jgi:hypothetical protein
MLEVMLEVVLEAILEVMLEVVLTGLYKKYFFKKKHIYYTKRGKNGRENTLHFNLYFNHSCDHIMCVRLPSRIYFEQRHIKNAPGL